MALLHSCCRGALERDTFPPTAPVELLSDKKIRLWFQMCNYAAGCLHSFTFISLVVLNRNQQNCYQTRCTHSEAHVIHMVCNATNIKALMHNTNSDIKIRCIRVWPAARHVVDAFIRNSLCCNAYGFKCKIHEHQLDADTVRDAVNSTNTRKYAQLTRTGNGKDANIQRL